MKYLLGFFCFCLCFLSACATGEWELREARVGGEIMLDVQGQILTIDLDTGVVIGSGAGVRVLRWRITSSAVAHGLGSDQRIDITSTHAAHDLGWRRCYDVRLLFQGVPLGHQFCRGPEQSVEDFGRQDFGRQDFEADADDDGAEAELEPDLEVEE